MVTQKSGEVVGAQGKAYSINFDLIFISVAFVDQREALAQDLAITHVEHSLPHVFIVLCRTVVEHYR